MKLKTLLTTTLILCFTSSGFPYDSSSNKVSMNIKLDRKVFYTGKPVKAVLKLSVISRGWSKKRVPVNLAILIDKSASMKGPKMKMACQAAIYARKKLNKNDIVSVITYGNDVETVIPAGTSFNANDLKRISSIQSSGNTALFSGLARAIFEIRKNLSKRYINRIVIISDGLANIGITGVEDFERLGASLKKESISVSTIGIGTEYNEDLMVGISQKSSGNSYFVEKPKRLLKAFGKEITQLLSVVARDISVIIECNRNVKPLRIVGREGRINNGTITLSLDQLSQNQNKFVLLEIMVPKGMSHKKIEIAKAFVTYEDPFLKRERSINGYIDAAYSDKENIVRNSENKDVKRSYLKNLNAISNEKVLNLLNKGKKREAAKVLLESSKRLSKAALDSDDEEVIQEAKEMEQNVQDVQKAGKFSRKKRKVLKMKSYKTRTQQAN